MKNLSVGCMILFVAFLITECTGKEGEEKHNQKRLSIPLGTVAVSDTGKAVITRSYLTGQWCYAYIEAGFSGDKQRDEQNITYLFNEDGSLLYQNNPTTPVEKEGSYDLDEGKLTILPALRFLPHEIYSVDEDRFVLGNSVTQLAFTRGACGS